MITYVIDRYADLPEKFIQMKTRFTRGGRPYTHPFLGEYALSARLQKVLEEEYGVSIANNVEFPEAFFKKHSITVSTNSGTSPFGPEDGYVTSNLWYGCEDIARRFERPENFSLQEEDEQCIVTDVTERSYHISQDEVVFTGNPDIQEDWIEVEKYNPDLSSCKVLQFNLSQETLADHEDNTYEAWKCTMVVELKKKIDATATESDFYRPSIVVELTCHGVDNLAHEGTTCLTDLYSISIRGERIDVYLEDRGFDSPISESEIDLTSKNQNIKITGEFCSISVIRYD